MQKKIKFNLDKRKAVILYASLIGVLYKLSKREIQVLSEFMLLDLEYGSYDFESKKKLVFHSDRRKDIQDKLSISSHNLNNIVSSFRKKKILVGDYISKNILLDGFEDNLKIIFDINV